MKPLLGSHVVYVAAGGDRAAIVTRVVLTRSTPVVTVHHRGPFALTETTAAAASSLEADYDVYLAVLDPTPVTGGISFLADPVPYDAGNTPAVGTWHWAR